VSLAVDRNGCKNFRTNRARAKPLRGAEGALDSPICSEERLPLRSTAFSDRAGFIQQCT
jgi:hypothetical protein